MKTVTWIVMNGDNEITRVSTKRMAHAIANEIGGYVIKYSVEG